MRYFISHHLLIIQFLKKMHKSQHMYTTIDQGFQNDAAR